VRAAAQEVQRMATISSPRQDALERVKANVELEDVLKSNHEQISTEVREFARHEVGLLGRLFPTKMARLFNQQELLNAKTELEFRHRLLQLHVDFQLATLNEKYETWLKVIKVEFRQQFIAFVTQRQQQLRREIDERRKDYVRDDKDRWDFYQQYKELPAGIYYWESIQEETIQYFDWLNKLMSDFQNIVDEKIKSYLND
jgi:hypothetical protein